MMVEQAQFESYVAHKASNPEEGSELLISVDAPDRVYVDDIAGKVKTAGGALFAPPAEIQGWMYGLGFVDLDGHRWNIVYLDWDNLPKE